MNDTPSPETSRSTTTTTSTSKPARPARHPLIELTRVRLLEFWRDPGALFWVFGFPLLLAIALGVAFRTKPPPLTPVAVVASAQPWSAALLQKAGGFDVRPLDEEGAARALRKSAVDVVIVESRVVASAPRAVTLRFDPTRPEGTAARTAAHDALERGLGRVDVIATQEETATAVGTRYVDFLIPGLIGSNIMGSSFWGVGFAIVDARRRKLLKRYAATPMHRSHYLASHILSRFVFLALEVAVLLALGRFLFGVQLTGSIPSIVLFAFAGGASFTGLSLLVASRTASTEVASGWVNFAMLPMWLLSGSFFSYERFPGSTHPWIRALPLTALNDGLRALINDGASLADVAMPLLVLALWGVVPFVVALRIFRWK